MQIETDIRDDDPRPLPMTMGLWARFSRAIGAKHQEAAEAHRTLAERVADLEQRLEAAEREAAELRERGIRYRGTYQRADQYQRGDLITHKGSMWACVADATDDEPGESRAWQLAVKAGRDGRDAR